MIVNFHYPSVIILYMDVRVISTELQVAFCHPDLLAWAAHLNALISPVKMCWQPAILPSTGNHLLF